MIDIVVRIISDGEVNRLKAIIAMGFCHKFIVAHGLAHAKDQSMIDFLKFFSKKSQNKDQE